MNERESTELSRSEFLRVSAVGAAGLGAGALDGLDQQGPDFVHKVGVSSKEAKESLFWLKVIQRAKLVKPDRFAGLIQESDELCAILASSRSTARAGGKTR